MARPLDRSRPLWEMYLIEGLENGDFAVVTKSHQVLVDGTGAIDISQVMLDSHAEVPDDTPDVWNPRPSGLCKKHCVVLECPHNGRS